MLLNFFKLLMEVIQMETRRKHKLSARLQIVIEVYALEISLGEKTIEDVPNWGKGVLKVLVLEECKVVYNCDGYGKVLEEKTEVTA